MHAMTELAWQMIECGFCRHPEFSIRGDGRWRVCEFPALVALLTHPARGHLLFDTGYSHHFFTATDPWPERLYRCVTPVELGPGQSLAQQLRHRGIDTVDIRHIFLSHFHGDHVGGLPDFGAAALYCAREAWEDLHSRGRVSRLRKGLLAALAPRSLAPRLTFFEDVPTVPLASSFAPFHSAHDLFGDGSALAVSLPGHAAGHYGLAFRAEGRWVFLVGDAAWTSAALKRGVPPPRATTDWLGDTAAYRATFQALHGLATGSSGMLVVPAHCADFRP